MELTIAQPNTPTWEQVESFLLHSTDPVTDLLLWADVRSAMSQLSTIWLATQEDQAVGVAFSCALWPERSALGLKGLGPAIEQEMLHRLVAREAFTQGFVIGSEDHRALFEQFGTLSHPHQEVHMVLRRTEWDPSGEGRAVRLAGFEELDRFYREQGAEVWNPRQYETGPYFVADVDGEIAAAAGTHFSYPGLFQLGNVLTHPAHRGKGLARACTSAVIDALFEQGFPLCSLFVVADNAPALTLYRKLGFRPYQRLWGFSWDGRI